MKTITTVIMHPETMFKNTERCFSVDYVNVKGHMMATIRDGSGVCATAKLVSIDAYFQAALRKIAKDEPTYWLFLELIMEKAPWGRLEK